MTDTSFYCWKYGFFFRICGYGLHVKSAKGHRPLFSERHGYTKAWYFLGLRFEILKPWKRDATSESEALSDGGKNG